MRLAAALHQHVQRGDLGIVLAPPYDIVLSRFDVVPDIVFVSRERTHFITEKNLKGRPDLVVEILSPSTRDRDLALKRDLYERSGVREYWLVDADSERVTVLPPSDQGFGPAVELTAEHGELASPVLSFFFSVDCLPAPAITAPLPTLGAGPGACGRSGTASGPSCRPSFD